MSVHAGSIITVAGQNVIDRIQEAGLGDTKLPIETIREVGNREVVDKVPGEPDYTFTMNSFNVGVELMALLTGKVGGSATASASYPGSSDEEGTEYDWLDCGFINILSPWKDPDSKSEGKVDASMIVPGFYPTRITYRFGATDNSTQEVELAGGSYYYCENAGVYEEYLTGTGAKTEWATQKPAIHYRKGGAEGSTFRSIFGVIVDGELLTEGIDYEVTGGGEHPGTTATIKFTVAPASEAKIRFCYFSGEGTQAFPQSVHASTVVLPGAVRGRNIKVYVDGNRIGGIQTAELNATIEGEVERELGSEEVIGRTINGTDANGTVTIRSKNKSAFFDVLEKVTDVDRKEVFGFFNLNTVDLQIRIENPKNPGQILKTLRVADAQFQPPGTPARVNSPTDFAFGFESLNGSFKEVKGTPKS